MQREVTGDMRATLVDWLVEVMDEYDAQLSTVFVAIQLLDMVLQTFSVEKKQFQLLGCACLVLAFKAEEIRVSSTFHSY